MAKPTTEQVLAKITKQMKKISRKLAKIQKQNDEQEKKK